MANHHEFKINLNVFADQLRGEIGSDLSTLQIINSAIDKNTYSENSYTLRQNTLSSNVPLPPSEFLVQREINKCFKSIIGALQDYMDKLIAAIELSRKTFSPLAGTSAEDVAKLINDEFGDSLIRISTNPSYNVPKKLELLLGSPETANLKKVVQSYFDVRNGIEHHKGIAKKDRVLS